MEAKKRFVFLLMSVSILVGVGFAFAGSAWPRAEILSYVGSDTVPPTGSIAINGGAANTNSAAVSLSLSAVDDKSGVATMRLSNDGVSWEATEAYSSAKSWVLPAGDGYKSVWAVFIDYEHNESNPVFDSILVDTIPPTASVRARAKVFGARARKRFPVSWSGSDAGSGVKDYDVEYKIGKRGPWKRWKTGVNALSARFTARVGKTYFFRARANDGAGNIGAWSRVKRTVVRAL